MDAPSAVAIESAERSTILKGRGGPTFGHLILNDSGFGARFRTFLHFSNVFQNLSSGVKMSNTHEGWRCLDFICVVAVWQKKPLVTPQNCRNKERDINEGSLSKYNYCNSCATLGVGENERDKNVEGHYYRLVQDKKTHYSAHEPGLRCYTQLTNDVRINYIE